MSDKIRISKSNFAELMERTPQNFSNKQKSYFPGITFDTKIDDLVVPAEFDENGDILVKKVFYDKLLALHSKRTSIKASEGDTAALLASLVSNLKNAGETLQKQANEIIGSDIAKYNELVKRILTEFKQQVYVKESALAEINEKHKVEIKEINERHLLEIKKINVGTELLKKSYDESLKFYKENLESARENSIKAHERLYNMDYFIGEVKKERYYMLHFKYIAFIAVMITLFIGYSWYKENQYFELLNSNIEKMKNMTTQSDGKKTPAKKKQKSIQN